MKGAQQKSALQLHCSDAHEMGCGQMGNALAFTLLKEQKGVPYIFHFAVATTVHWHIKRPTDPSDLQVRPKPFRRRPQRTLGLRICAASVCDQCNDPAQGNSLTLSEALKFYHDAVAVGKAGKRQAQSRIKNWQKYPFASRKIGQLFPADFDEYVLSRRAEGMAGSTVRNELASCQAPV